MAMLVLACGTDAPDSREPVPPATEAPAATVPPVPVGPAAWPSEYGVLLVLPAPSGEGAALVPPLAPSVTTADAVLAPTEGLDVDLFARGGSAGVGLLSASRRMAGECPAWPQSPLAAELMWRVGLTRGVAAAVPLDSIEGLSPRDSSQFAIKVTQLASRVPGDTAEAFRGLPYVIRGAWSAPLDSGGELLIALAARTLAIEDDPRSEQITLVAERDSSAREPALRYADRRSASESLVDIDEVLALIRFTASGRLGLLIERADARGAMLLLLERDSAGTWTRRWQGPRTGC